MANAQEVSKVIVTSGGLMLFPESLVRAFRHTDSSARWGQAFYDFAKLHKCEQDRAFCDKLYSAADPVAKAMVRDRTQTGQ